MLEWKPEYATGVPEVDTDHQHLIRGLNHLETALERGEGADVVEALLAFIQTYSNHHFGREEGCMMRLKCPTAAANKAAHEQFRSRFAAAKVRLSSPAGATTAVALGVHRELSDWMADHILRVDSGLKQCLHAGEPSAT